MPEPDRKKKFRRTVLIRIELPLQHAKILAKWAEMKNTNRTNLSGNVVQARAEANEAQINEWTQRQAEDLGIPLEEYEREIFEKHKLYEDQAEDD